MQDQAEMANKMTTPEILALRCSRTANRDNPIAIASARKNRWGDRKATCPKTKKPNMPANGRYNRQGLNQSRQLLAPSKSRHRKTQMPPRDTLAAGHPKPLARLRIRHRPRALQGRANPT